MRVFLAGVVFALAESDGEYSETGGLSADLSAEGSETGSLATRTTGDFFKNMEDNLAKAKAMRRGAKKEMRELDDLEGGVHETDHEVLNEEHLVRKRAEAELRRFHAYEDERQQRLRSSFIQLTGAERSEHIRRLGEAESRQASPREQRDRAVPEQRDRADAARNEIDESLARMSQQHKMVQHLPEPQKPLSFAEIPDVEGELSSLREQMRAQRDEFTSEGRRDALNEDLALKKISTMLPSSFTERSPSDSLGGEQLEKDLADFSDSTADLGKEENKLKTDAEDFARSMESTANGSEDISAPVASTDA